MQPTSNRTEKTRRKEAFTPDPTPAVQDVRERIQTRIQFPQGSAWAEDTPLASAFKEALCEALLTEDIERIRVRCGVARDEANSLRFMCKVEYAGDDANRGLASYPWSWWSPLMEKPEELGAELRRALRSRHEKMTSARSRQVPPPRADKARGPSHDTWTTQPWDLGRSVQNDSFCRNRRGRWNGQPAVAKPFRPRSPR
jgi:hypothetical protein